MSFQKKVFASLPRREFLFAFCFLICSLIVLKNKPEYINGKLWVSRKSSDEQASGVLQVERGKIHPLLHLQALSHYSYHKHPIRHALAELAGKPKTVIVVGIAKGMDVLKFLEDGYRVIGFEPMKRFHQSITERISMNPKLDGKIYHNAAGNETSEIKLSYLDSEPETVKIVKIDDVVREPVTAMTVDVQGFEYSVIQGAQNLIFSTVNILWFEINPALLPTRVALLNLLDEHFALFDFVPIVRSQDQTHKLYNESRNYIFNTNRPSSFQGYMDWMSSEKKKNDYSMIQTDILAVRRSLLPSVWGKLSTLAEDYCKHPDSYCKLRELLKNGNKI